VTARHLPRHYCAFSLVAGIGFRLPFLTAVVARSQREWGADRLGPHFLSITLATARYMPRFYCAFGLIAGVDIRLQLLTTVVARPQREWGADRQGPRFFSNIVALRQVQRVNLTTRPLKWGKEV